MSDKEIKEILEALKPHDKEFAKTDIKEYSLVLSVKEQKILLDYITNIQKENEKYKKILDKIKEYCIKEQARIVINNTEEDEFVYTELLQLIDKLLEEIE